MLGPVTRGWSGGLQRAQPVLFGGELRKWAVLGTLIGVIAGLGAIAFVVAIDWSTELFLGAIAGYDPPMARGEGETVVTDAARPWLFPVVTTVGGLLSGLLVFTLAPEAEGHGTDAAIDAFHHRAGRIRARIPLIKLAASAITIGSGGSAGREGPTAQIAAGFGSWLGEALRLSPQDRRTALAVGIGAGVGAIFKAPLGGALLSAEILYLREFELEAIIPSLIASVVGFTIFAAWSGWDPVFGADLGYQFTDPASLGWYFVLGAVAAVVGIAYVRSFYGAQELFRGLRVPRVVQPAIGGLAVGLIALWRPEVLSMGYGWLQLAIEGDTVQLATSTMLLLVVLKTVATALTIGSGGSGGVFAPGLFIGGMVGASMWALLHDSVPGMPPVAEPFVVVGMGAMFGGIAKAPIAVMVMVAEMTGEFTMIVPAMAAVSVAYVLTGNISIYRSQLPTRADSPAHRGEFAVPLVQTVSVEQAMRREVPTVAPSTPVAEARALLATRDTRALPVVDGERLVGVFTTTDALYARLEGRARVGEAMHPQPLVAYPTETLFAALRRMAHAAISGLPVVAQHEPERLVGFVALTDIARVLDLQVNELAARPEAVRSAADDPLRYVTVEEGMSRRFQVVRQTDPVETVAAQLAAVREDAALVVDDTGALAGIVTIGDLERAAVADPSDGVPVARFATRLVVTARPGDFIADALARPGAETAQPIPVVDMRDGRSVPIGVLRRSDVVVAYLRGRERLRSQRRHTPAGRDGSGPLVATELPIERTDVANGRTLAELRLPGDAVVTAVERDGSLLVPRGHLRLLAGDRVRLLCREEDVAAALAGLRSGEGRV